MRRDEEMRTKLAVRTLAPFVVLLSAAMPAVFGDGPAPSDPFRRTSPQSSALAFLEACKAKDYTRALRYIDMRKLPQETTLEKRTELAKQLDEVLEHDPQFDAAALSAKPDGDPPSGADRERVATLPLNGRAVDLYMERIMLRSGALVWKFTSDTVALIPGLAKASSTSPLERHMPDLLVSATFFGAPAWVWIALVALAAAVTLIVKLGGWILPLLLKPLVARIAPNIISTARDALLGPIELLAALAMFRAGVVFLAPPLPLDLYVARGLSAMSIGGLAWLFAGIFDVVMERVRRALALTHPRFSSSVLPLMARVVKVSGLAFGFIAILSSWGYNTNTVLAGVGIGGVAIAFAAQKTLENLFGGVAVVSDQPVFVGDFCRFGDSVGTVEDIGLRSTRIRTLDRTLVTIPNAQFSSMSLENFSRRDKMLFHPVLNLKRDTTPAQVRSILDSIRRMLSEDRRVEEGNLPVRFTGVGSYSLDVEVFAYILTGDGDQFLAIQQELLLKILDTIAEAGTALAIPTQASVVYSADSPALASK